MVGTSQSVASAIFGFVLLGLLAAPSFAREAKRASNPDYIDLAANVFTEALRDNSDACANTGSVGHLNPIIEAMLIDANASVESLLGPLRAGSLVGHFEKAMSEPIRGDENPAEKDKKGKLADLDIGFAVWAYETGYLGYHPFAACREISGKACIKDADGKIDFPWQETRDFFRRWLEAAYFDQNKRKFSSDEAEALDRIKTAETAKERDKWEKKRKEAAGNLRDLHREYKKFRTPHDKRQKYFDGDYKPGEIAPPTDLLGKLTQAEIELTCPDSKSLEKGLEKVEQRVAFRLTPEDLVKDRDDADGGKLSWSRSTTFETQVKEETGETEVIRTVDDDYNFEGTLGINLPWLGLLNPKDVFVYARYNHDDDDTRVDNINEDKAKCLAEKAEVEPFKSNPRLCDTNKTRVLTLGYIAEYDWDVADFLFNIGFALDVHNNSQTARFRGTIDFKKSVVPCQDKLILRGLVFSCEPSLVGESAWIIDAGDNIELIDLNANLDDPNGVVIDSSGQYTGIGGKILGKLDFLKRFALKASYRYLLVPGDRVRDQNLFEASLNFSLDENKRWSLEIKRTDGDDIDDFSNQNKWEISVNSKF